MTEEQAKIMTAFRKFEGMLDHDLGEDPEDYGPWLQFFAAGYLSRKEEEEK